MNISTNFVMVILEAKSNPVIMESRDSLRSQQAAGMATLEGERLSAKEPRL